MTEQAFDNACFTAPILYHTLLHVFRWRVPFGTRCAFLEGRRESVTGSRGIRSHSAVPTQTFTTERTGARLPSFFEGCVLREEHGESFFSLRGLALREVKTINLRLTWA